MASSLPEANLTRARELGKYSRVTESQSGNERPQDKNRSVTVEEVDFIRKCAGCGKNMRKVKDRFVCACKSAIHCSKQCLKSSKHRCGELEVEDQGSAEKFLQVMNACCQRYRDDRNAGRGPSSDKVAWLKNVTRGDQKRILRYAESGNPTAAYVVGIAFAERGIDPRRIFAFPLKYEKQSVVETNETAVKWLKVAAEGGIPEAMFLLFAILTEDCSLKVDRRVADYWLAQAHATGKIEYLIEILEIGSGGYCFPTELLQIELEEDYFLGSTLSDLLMAARFLEIKAWGGKTAMEEPFYGWRIFNSIVESIGDIDYNQSKPSFICGEKKTVRFVSGRYGYSHLPDRDATVRREENNLKFKQGAKSPVSHDFELVCQTCNLDGRTRYLITCKHDGVKPERTKFCVKYVRSESVVDNYYNYKSAGDCVGCAEEARQRLRAVSLGLFSMSLIPVLGSGLYAARYATEDGIIVQDVFGGYSKPSMRQALQCLMSNPVDLHPLAVAEDTNLFWPIIWFWGSVYEAVEDACNKTTLEVIYHNLGDKITTSQDDKSCASLVDESAGNQVDKSARNQVDKSAGNQVDKSASSLGDKSSISQVDKSAGRKSNKSAGRKGNKSAGSQDEKSAGNKDDKSAASQSGNASGMAAFPEDAAGEWRIACGNDDCPLVDHEVKFNVCAGCGIRRYCDVVCQKKDWPKHSKFCDGMSEEMGGMPGGMGSGAEGAGSGPTIEEVD